MSTGLSENVTTFSQYVNVVIFQLSAVQILEIYNARPDNIAIFNLSYRLTHAHLEQKSSTGGNGNRL